MIAGHDFESKATEQLWDRHHRLTAGGVHRWKELTTVRRADGLKAAFLAPSSHRKGGDSWDWSVTTALIATHAGAMTSRF